MNGQRSPEADPTQPKIGRFFPKIDTSVDGPVVGNSITNVASLTVNHFTNTVHVHGGQPGVTYTRNHVFDVDKASEEKAGQSGGESILEYLLGT
jgi:hypothetical protein